MSTDSTEQIPIEDEPLELAPRKNRGDEIEMDITPMIDITFLLLIFFLVASKMDAEQAVKLPPAQGTHVSSKNSVVLLLRKASEDKVSVQRKDGTAFRDDDNKLQEEEITKYIEDGLRGRGAFSEKKEQVLLRAEMGVKHKEVARIGRAIGRAKLPSDTEDLTVEVVYIAVKQTSQP